MSTFYRSNIAPRNVLRPQYRLSCPYSTCSSRPIQRRRHDSRRRNIFSPVTAGLYSLMSLGRMGVAWLSILARSIELVQRILAPEQDPPSGANHNLHEKRSNTFELGDIRKRPETEGVDDAISPTINPRHHLSRSNSVPDPRPSGVRSQSDPTTFGPTSERPHLPQRPTALIAAHSAQ